MRVLVAGATGMIGRRLVPMLVAAGHQVTGLTRSRGRTAVLTRARVQAIVCDVFDAEALGATMRAVRPEAVINQLTALPPRINPRQVPTAMTATNRLRIEGTARLANAAR